jgi:hypothetical protein
MADREPTPQEQAALDRASKAGADLAREHMEPLGATARSIIEQRIEEARADERRKVLAELTGACDGSEMPAVLAASRRVRDGRWIRGAAATHVLADLMLELERDGWFLVRPASLLAPEGEGDGRNDKDRPAESGADKAAITGPSSEPARVGDDEPWVNGIIEITVPLDDVSVDDEPSFKLGVVGELHAELVGALPDSFAQCVSSGRWEDVQPATGGGTRPYEERSAHG